MSKIQIVQLLDSCDIPREVTKQYLQNNPCNNGHTAVWTVQDPNDPEEGYPEINQFLIDEGCLLGEEVYIYFNW